MIWLEKNFSVGEGNEFPFVSLSPTHTLMHQTTHAQYDVIANLRVS